MTQRTMISGISTGVWCKVGCLAVLRCQLLGAPTYPMRMSQYQFMYSPPDSVLYTRLYVTAGEKKKFTYAITCKERNGEEESGEEAGRRTNFHTLSRLPCKYSLRPISEPWVTKLFFWYPSKHCSLPLGRDTILHSTQRFLTSHLWYVAGLVTLQCGCQLPRA